MLIQGLVHAGTKVSLAGGSKRRTRPTGRCCIWDCQFASGTPWLGFIDRSPARCCTSTLRSTSTSCRERVRCTVDGYGNHGASNVFVLAFAGPWLFPRKRSFLISSRLRCKTTHLFLGGRGSDIQDDGSGRDECSAGGIADLLNQLEQIAVSTGAAVLFGSHFSKGNQAGKEVLDRVSGSGVFARDPDTIVTITRHDEDGAFVVEPHRAQLSARVALCRALGAPPHAPGRGS